ncbi:hypothetical protein SKAU_G00360770 [Synaphobranchus kaupii]|uniref:Uncharacterized protein n=1 Tax=Synaphobranchus kaupii TaxID=118154 RepID=A0A9Q1EI59_SYNKA|nr:hypothetical protein SKAU_G00360770 [Synaphobranchus kaupii]
MYRITEPRSQRGRRNSLLTVPITRKWGDLRRVTASAVRQNPTPTPTQYAVIQGPHNGPSLPLSARLCVLQLALKLCLPCAWHKDPSSS